MTMKLSKTTLAAFICALLIGISSVAVVFAKSDKEKDQEVAFSDCKLEKYTDPEVMAVTMADPAKFMEMMMLMSNPQTAQSMLECGMDSNQWNDLMANMSNPTKMMNAMSQFMNPQMYMNWMTASMNPQTYQSSMNTFMNPAMYMQWMTASMNPMSFQPMFGAMFQTPVVADATDAKQI